MVVVIVGGDLVNVVGGAYGGDCGRYCGEGSWFVVGDCGWWCILIVIVSGDRGWWYMVVVIKSGDMVSVVVGALWW